MGKDGGYKSIFPNIGANKHHRQLKFARRSTKHSVVQSTCELSRGWMMRRELRSEGLVGRARSKAKSDGPKLRRNKNRCWFPDLGFQSVVSQMVSQNMVSQSKNGFPKYGFSIKKWFPKIWFLNQNLVNYMFPNQTSAFSRHSATDSSKCASTTDSSKCASTTDSSKCASATDSRIP